jgi:hypothetical protein
VAAGRSRGRNLNQILAERRARRLSRLRTLLIAAAATVVLVVLVRAYLEQRRVPAIEEGRVVVAPFENRTGDASLDAIGLVASDWITRVLSGYARHRSVVPTTTALAYVRSAQLARYDLYTRAQRLARGTRAQVVVWGTYYQTGDTLRFTVEMRDLKTELMMGAPPQIVTTADDVMSGIERLRHVVVRQVMQNELYVRPRPRPVPELAAYQAFVGGLSDMVNRRYHDAAIQFGHAARADTISWLPHQIWLIESLIDAREFARADSAWRALRGRRVVRLEEARAMRSRARLLRDREAMHNWSYVLAGQNAADDAAHYDLALDALALGRAREARRVMGEMFPTFGMLHGRPDFYLHHAAAYHLLSSHQEELRIVRAGIRARHRSLDVRLANCRVRAGLARHDEAMAALNAIVARDTDTTSIITLGAALDDCAAELEAHGLTRAAAHAQMLSRQWHQRRPTARPIVRDPVYERGYRLLEQARTAAERGDGGRALTTLYDAISNGLPYYEPGRMMLHAEPAFRRLRNTRGFRQINQTRG